MIYSRTGKSNNDGSTGPIIARIADNGSIAITSLTDKPPFYGMLRSMHSDYAVQLLSDGKSVSYLKDCAITPEHGEGKALFIRDNDTGETWSAFRSPLCWPSDEYGIRYKPGQATLRSLISKIETELTLASSPDRPCELWFLRLQNNSAMPRSLTITTYFEPSHTVTMESKYVQKEGALLLRQSLDKVESGECEHSEMTIFHGCTLRPTAHSTEKSIFVNEGTGTIASLTVNIEMPIEGEAVLGFCTGIAPSAKEALEHVRAYRSIHDLEAAVQLACNSWQSVTVELDSPDSSINAFINKWLAYLSICEARKPRISAFDRLRALYPVCRAFVEETRSAILACAGAITLSNTLLGEDGVCIQIAESESIWLPATVSRLVAETRDESVLSQRVALVGGPMLTIREHCERLLRTCLNSNSPDVDWKMLDRIIHDWRLLPGNVEQFESYIDRLATRRLSVPPTSPEQVIPPRRLGYLQTLCPTLASTIDWSKLASNASESDLLRHFVESCLGLHLTFVGIEMEQSMSLPWPECRVTLRLADDTYRITLQRASSSGHCSLITIDGEPLLGRRVPYIGDGKTHEVVVSEY